MTHKLNKAKAFTLIELLVVIAIIGLLASIIAIVLSKPRSKARDAARKKNIQNIALACQMYYDDYGHFPNGAAAFGSTCLSCDTQADCDSAMACWPDECWADTNISGANGEWPDWFKNELAPYSLY